jgi:hypothetical protein
MDVRHGRRRERVPPFAVELDFLFVGELVIHALLSSIGAGLFVGVYDGYAVTLAALSKVEGVWRNCAGADELIDRLLSREVDAFRVLFGGAVPNIKHTERGRGAACVARQV